jgi:hypothetical protein
MKKTIIQLSKSSILRKLSTLLIFISGAMMAQPTCTLDPVFVASPKYGIWPDSATNFASGQVGVAYAQNITVKVPLDTVQTPIKICFTRFELLVPPSYPNYNLPPGLTLTGNPSNLKFPGNANSCAIISGTPTTAGTYTVHFQVDAYGTTILSFQNCPTPVNPNTGSKITTQNIDYYIINISPATIIQQYQNISNLNVFPNPAIDKLNISFNSTVSDNFQFTLFDITGKTLINQNIKSTIGENKTTIDVSELDNGIYFYTISNSVISQSNKIIINK